MAVMLVLKLVVRRADYWDVMTVVQMDIEKVEMMDGKSDESRVNCLVAKLVGRRVGRLVDK